MEQRIREELERLLVDAHGVPSDERDQWARRLARAAKGIEPDWSLNHAHEHRGHYVHTTEARCLSCGATAE